MKNKIITLFLFVLLSVAFSGNLNQVFAEASSVAIPFQPGEKLTYKLRWGMVTAGYADLEVLPFQETGGQKNWHFVLTIRTSSFVDLFYKVRDRIESVIARAMRPPV